MTKRQGRKGLGMDLGNMLFSNRPKTQESEIDVMESSSVPPPPIPAAPSYPSAPQASPIFSPIPQAMPTFATPPQAAPTFATPPQAPDGKALKKVQDAVFTQLDNRPSRFIPFMRMHERLGRPADIGVVVGALQDVDPGFSVEAIAADAMAHRQSLEAFCAAVDADFATERQSRIGGRDAECAELQRLNEQAQREIERHTKESQDRAAKITEINTQKAAEEEKLARSQQNITSAEDAVRASLDSAIALLAPYKGKK